ncbi:uncharacterized protein F54H12.2-like [Ciona intestinalis]
MQSKLHLDRMFQQRYLINNVDVKLKLTRSRDAFATIGVAGFKIKILAAVLHVRKVKISPSVQLGHITALSKDLCLYPILRAELKTLTIPRFNQSISHDNLFLGQLPRRVILGFVDNDAFNGRIDKNPFHFKTYGLSSLSLHSNGKQVPAKELTPNYGVGTYIRSYMSLFTGLNTFYTNASNGISREEYPRGFTLYAFDLTPDLASSGHFDLLMKRRLKYRSKIFGGSTNVSQCDNLRRVPKSYSNRSAEILTDRF